MTRRWVCICIVLSLAVTQLSCSDKDFSELIAELSHGKARAARLVSEVKASMPDQRDRALLKDKYELAQDSYRKWSLEAAAAVRRGDDVKLNSERAKNAEVHLNELGDFARDYADRRAKEERDRKIGSDLSGKEIWGAIKQAAKLVKDNWDTIEKVAKAYKRWRDAEQKKRDEAADKITEAGIWPAFNEIPSAIKIP